MKEGSAGYKVSRRAFCYSLLDSGSSTSLLWCRSGSILSLKEQQYSLCDEFVLEQVDIEFPRRDT